jgi:hypothetical protein
VFTKPGEGGRRSGASQAPARRILNINCWNEWTEGSYLEPDTVHGTKYLEAVRAVLGVRAAESGRKPVSPRPEKVTVGPRELIRSRENTPFVMDSTHGDELVFWWRRGETVPALVGRRDPLRAALLIDEESGQWMPYSTFLADERDRQTDEMNAVGAEFFLLISATNYAINSL